MPPGKIALKLLCRVKGARGKNGVPHGQNGAKRTKLFLRLFCFFFCLLDAPEPQTASTGSGLWLEDLGGRAKAALGLELIAFAFPLFPFALRISLTFASHQRLNPRKANSKTYRRDSVYPHFTKFFLSLGAKFLRIFGQLGKLKLLGKEKAKSLYAFAILKASRREPAFPEPRFPCGAAKPECRRAIAETAQAAPWGLS